jgi:hypothetical protein
MRGRREGGTGEEGVELSPPSTGIG